MSFETHTPQDSAKSRRIPAQQPKNAEVTTHDVRRAEQYSALRELDAVDIDDPYFEFDPGQKEKDKAFVLRMKQKFATDDPEIKKMSAIAGALEYVVVKRITEHAWFGKNMRAQSTSHYDDIQNAIDLYLEDITSPDAEPLGLSMDVTFATGGGKNRMSGVEGKLLDLKMKFLQRGELPQLTYYKPISPEVRKAQEAKGKPKAVFLPKVVIGLSLSAALQSIKLFEKDPTNPDIARSFIAVYQVERQLKTFAEYSEHVGARGYSRVKEKGPIYRQALEKFKNLIDDNIRSLKQDPEEVRKSIVMIAERDPATMQIIEMLNSFLDEAYAKR